MKVLVLGGTRFVGLRLVRRLIEQGHAVCVLNRGKTESALPGAVARLVADRRDPEAVRAALAPHRDAFDWVFDVTGYQRANLEPVVESLTGRVARYLFVSSFAVYRRPQVFPTREDTPRLSPDTAERGFAAYGAEKVACEDYLFEAHAARGLPITIVRTAALYGPENWMDDREGSYFARLLLGRQILVGGRGESLVHLGHADDLAAACLAAAESPRAIGEAYHATGAQAITVDGLLEAIAAAAGTELRRVYVPYGAVRGSLDGIVPLASEMSAVHSIDKARDHFGFWPEYDYRSGMAHTFEWWRRERGPERIRFVPGKLGHDVDLAAEDAAIARWEGQAPPAPHGQDGG